MGAKYKLIYELLVATISHPDYPEGGGEEN